MLLKRICRHRSTRGGPSRFAFVLGLAITFFVVGPASSMQMVADNEKLNRQCLRDAPGSNAETASAGVRIGGATAYEHTLVNRAVAKMDSLSAGGKFHRLRGLNIVFLEALDRASCLPSSQARGYVEIGRHCPAGSGMEYNFIKDSGAGLLVHEIGHHVGNAGKGYIGYPGGCHITGYCTHSSAGQPHSYNQQLHEEFAEVFAAYVLNPGLIRHTPGCAPALHHMHALFGGRTPGLTCQSNSEPAQQVPVTHPANLAPRPQPTRAPLPQPRPTVLSRPVGPAEPSDFADDYWEMPRAPRRAVQSASP